MNNKLFDVSWLSLDGLGRSRILWTSYLWLFIVPICAKSLQAIDNISVPFLASPIPLSLPFQWKLFYYGAVAVAISSFIYATRCPAFIKQFPNWSAFSIESQSGYRLLLEATRYAEECIPTIGEQEEFAADFANRFTKSLYSMRDAVRPQEMELAELQDHKPDPSCQSDAYEFLLQKWNVARRGWRIASAVLYAIGFTLFGLVLIQNFIFVVRMSLR